MSEEDKRSYMGMKFIRAWPKYWANGTIEGYHVEYPDGYKSYSPKEQFEEAYRRTGEEGGEGELGIGLVIRALKDGYMAQRAGWVQNETIFLVGGSTFAVNRAPLLGIFDEGAQITYAPHVDMVRSDGIIGTWNPTPEDLLAEDYRIFKGLNN